MGAPLNAFFGGYPSNLDWRDGRIAALEAQIDDCEKEINHWKYEAESSKAMWDQLKVERDTLEAQVQQLRDGLKDADHLCKWLLQSEIEINESDRDRVVREYGIKFAALAAAEPKEEI